MEGARNLVMEGLMEVMGVMEGLMEVVEVMGVMEGARNPDLVDILMMLLIGGSHSVQVIVNLEYKHKLTRQQVQTD